METLSPSALKVGMVLAKDVYGPSGRFLLGKDCELTDKHVQALLSWGVVSVDVVSNQNEDTGEYLTVPEEVKNTIIAKTDERLKHVEQSEPLIQALRDAVINFQMSQYGKG